MSIRQKILMFISVVLAIGTSGFAGPIWEENFDGLASGTGDLVTGDAPEFRGLSPTVSVGDWAVSSSSLSIADLGGGDHALRMDLTGGTRGAVIWLDTSDLGLTAGTIYTLQFSLENWSLNGTSGTQANVFGNVVRAKGIDTDAEGDASVAFDLISGSGFDPVVATNGAEIASTHNQWQTTFNPQNDGGVIIDQSQISGGSGTFTYDFISNDSEYLGVIIGKTDLNGERPTFDVTSVSIVPEPATIGMLGLGTIAALLVRRSTVRK